MAVISKMSEYEKLDEVVIKNLRRIISAIQNKQITLRNREISIESASFAEPMKEMTMSISFVVPNSQYNNHFITDSDKSALVYDAEINGWTIREFRDDDYIKNQGDELC